MIRTAGVVLAGGSGTRFGAEGNKVFLPLADRPVIAWSLAAIASAPQVIRLVLVIRPADRSLARQVADEIDLPVELVTGGAHRHESEYQALAHLAPAIRAGELDVVVIHDGARPLASTELTVATITAAWEHGAAVPGLQLGEVIGHDGADRLVRVQTPQAFRAEPLLHSYEQADRDGFAGTDTAACVQRYTDLPVRCLPGDPRNLKVTYPGDLEVAARLQRVC